MPMEPGHLCDSGYRIRGTVVAITGFVGVFLYIFFENSLRISGKMNMCHRAIIL